ncbi:MAG TPA: hypothetical protein VF482_16025 [Trebonia sp.]
MKLLAVMSENIHRFMVPSGSGTSSRICSPAVPPRRMTVIPVTAPSQMTCHRRDPGS